MKFSLVMMSLVLIPALQAQLEKQPIVYVKHLEPPYYPPIARQTGVHGTVVMKRKIGRMAEYSKSNLNRWIR